MLIGPVDVYVLALRGVTRAVRTFPVADELELARTLVAQSFQESCLRKNEPGLVCFDTQADAATSTAYGLMQVLKGTQRAIEKFMGWPERPLEDRADPQYAMDLGAAYMAYHLNKSKGVNGSIYRALVAYHDGHYSAKGAGHAYAKLILNQHYKRFDFRAIATEAAARDRMLATVEYYMRPEFR